MESLPGHDAWKTNAPGPPELDMDTIYANLEDCPWCHQSEHVIIEQSGGWGGSVEHFAYCHDCHCRGPEARTVEEAAEMWNDR